MKPKISKGSDLSRRDFLYGMAGGAAAFTIVGRHVLAGGGGAAPSEKLNIAAIGAGGMGAVNIENVASENIVALCDVDDERAKETYVLLPNVPKYRDFRVMLEKQKDIDAVIIATPDHMHAPAAMAAMQLGKHVYVQKPIAHTIWEARKMTEAACRYKVVSQMGNQGHSGEGVRLICEWIWDGAIGDIREVHAWTNRPVWPQGVKRPADTPRIPSTLDWNLWLGPAAERPYHPEYLPFVWRGWWDFGCGALGDMACHVLDPVVSALKLKYPTSVEACATEVNDETFPLASIVRYEFPARQGMPPVKVNWYDGGMKPPRPEALEPGRSLEVAKSDVLFIGDKGVLRCGEYGTSPRLIPETKMREYKRPPKTLSRIDTTHEMNWVGACKSGGQASSHFDYAGPFTEMVLLGNVALKFLGRRLEWDGENMKFTNLDEANKYVSKQYRKGWEIA